MSTYKPPRYRIRKTHGAWIIYRSKWQMGGGYAWEPTRICNSWEHAMKMVGCIPL